MPAEANMREIEGLTFYAIRKSDRQFAIAMCWDVQGTSPWDSTPGLAYITSLRNKAKDDASVKAEAENDANAADAIEEPKREETAALRTMRRSAVRARDRDPANGMR